MPCLKRYIPLEIPDFFLSDFHTDTSYSSTLLRTILAILLYTYRFQNTSRYLEPSIAISTKPVALSSTPRSSPVSPQQLHKRRPAQLPYQLPTWKTPTTNDFHHLGPSPGSFHHSSCCHLRCLLNLPYLQQVLQIRPTPGRSRKWRSRAQELGSPGHPFLASLRPPSSLVETRSHQLSATTSCLTASISRFMTPTRHLACQFTSSGSCY